MSATNAKTNQRRVAPALVVVSAFLAALFVASARPASSAVHGIYPTNGMPFMTGNVETPGEIYIGTNACDGWQGDSMRTVAASIQRSSVGSAALPVDRYPNGIDHKVRCMSENLPTGEVIRQDGLESPNNPYFRQSRSWDFYVWFDPSQTGFRQPNGSYIGGRIHRRAATAAFCAHHDLVHPCGSRDILQVNEQRYANRSDDSRANFFLHEFIHPHGLTDCEVAYPSVSPNGLCGQRPWIDRQDHRNGFTPNDLAAIADLYRGTFVDRPAAPDPEPEPQPQPPGDADAIVAGPEVTLTDSCLAGNGSVELNVVNPTTAQATYVFEFTGLSPRRVEVAPGDWGRLRITGRRDGAHDVRVLRDGVQLLSRSITVACDEAGPLPSPEVSIINSCRVTNELRRGYVLVQFVNPTSEERSYVIEFDGVNNRSTTAPAHGSALRAVTGRPDGSYGLVVRTGATVLHRATLVVRCADETPAPEPIDDQSRFPVERLSVSDRGTAMIEGHEGVHRSPYDDPRGYCTIGIGHLVALQPCVSNPPGLQELSVRFGGFPLSRAEVEQLFAEDIQSHTRLLSTHLGSYANAVSQQEFDALASLTFNGGPGVLGRMPSLRGELQKGPNHWNRDVIRREWDWGCPGGVAAPGLRGLCVRRTAEVNLFLDGRYLAAHQLFVTPKANGYIEQLIEEGLWASSLEGDTP